MTNIKMIYFDSVAKDSVLFESRLRTICASLYVIKEGLLLSIKNILVLLGFERYFSIDISKIVEP